MKKLQFTALVAAACFGFTGAAIAQDAKSMGLETTEEELMHTVFPHPTLSEMMHESVLDAYGRVIHM